MTMTKMAWALAGSLILMAASPAVAECMDGPFTVRLAASRLDTRLQDIAHKTGCALDVDPAVVGSRRVPALRGSFTTAQMLNSSLMRLGLDSTWDNNHWVIRPHQEGE